MRNPVGGKTRSKAQKIRRGERIARPFAKPGRIRRETLTVVFEPGRYAPEDVDAERQTIRPGDAFRRHSPTGEDSVYMYLGVSAEDRECMYMYELGRPGDSIKLFDRTSWVTDYENGVSWSWRVSLEEATALAYDGEE